jgi:phospholipase C
VVRFIEDNWLQGKRLGDGSNDAAAGSFMNMFDFHRPAPFATPPLFLDPDTGTEVASPKPPRGPGHRHWPRPWHGRS